MLTLTSDFGSPYPAAMKGVLLRETGGARLVDVAHDLPRQDVRAAAFWLREVLPWFPPAVHLAVVDPGVGTERAALIARAGEHALVGPDNGLLLPAARALAAGAPGGETAPAGAPGGDATPGEAVPGGAPGRADSPAGSPGHVTAPDAGPLPERPPDPDPDATTVAAGPDPDADVELFVAEYDAPASHTFHGRDVFAPAAARVHRVGVDRLETLDGVVPATEYEDCRFPRPALRDDGATGEVLVVDGFGNAITNVPSRALPDGGPDAVAVDGERVPFVRAYAAVAPGERLVTVGSHGNVELAVNRGRGDEVFGVAPGDAVDLAWAP